VRHFTCRHPRACCRIAKAETRRGPQRSEDTRRLPGGARRLNSQKWSGKTIAQHKADRATAVRETLLSAGIDTPELDRMAASVTLPDGSPRFVWTDTRPDHDTYVKVILRSVAERQRWRTEYNAAKTVAAAAAGPVDCVSTVEQPP
jgi:hypothetical protein